MLGLGRHPESELPDDGALDELLKHVPLSVLVELVEHRYRDRRNRAAIAVVGGALTLLAGSAALGYQMFLQMPATATEAVNDGQQRARREEYTERRARAQTRQQFARTAQSFESLNGSLGLDQSHPVFLPVGARHHYRVNITAEGRYRISISDRAAVGEETPAVPFTPVMYLYQLREGEQIARPEGTEIDTPFFDFNYEEDEVSDEERERAYYLEVESLLGDAGTFTLTLTER